MLRFRAYGLEIGSRHYILLPKLNRAQMEVLAGRLEGEGFFPRRGNTFVASSTHPPIHIDPSGLCWSSADPSDYVLPAIPDLLSCKKEAVSLETILAMYLVWTKTSGLLRMNLRTESMGNWDLMRASGGCGLAPDEHLMTLCMLGLATSAVKLTTDYPGEEARDFIVGRKMYFESKLAYDEASEVLRSVGTRKPRNAYIPRDGLIEAEGIRIRRRALIATAEEFGEWCSFTAA